MYTFSISGQTMTVEPRFLTGGILLRYLAAMTNTRLREAYRNSPYEYRPMENKRYGKVFSKGDVVDLEGGVVDFILTPVQVAY